MGNVSGDHFSLFIIQGRKYFNVSRLENVIDLNCTVYVRQFNHFLMWVSLTLSLMIIDIFGPFI